MLHLVRGTGRGSLPSGGQTLAERLMGNNGVGWELGTYNFRRNNTVKTRVRKETRLAADVKTSHRSTSRGQTRGNSSAPVKPGPSLSSAHPLHLLLLAAIGRGILSKTSGREAGVPATAMALATVWNYCVPLTIITVACLARTGKARCRVLPELQATSAGGCALITAINLATDRGLERQAAGGVEGWCSSGADGGKEERRNVC
ncbi:unnamed protein product [Pleuronectes platessa]|uniref:Uncharacterized protein n=1 Tax=Pleuronectes platessa TaxID=8262 RepID=A0A9N7THX2_PLEPL|nr:unnamed protein product [Pleuronectes platessa]